MIMNKSSYVKEAHSSTVDCYEQLMMIYLFLDLTRLICAQNNFKYIRRSSNTKEYTHKQQRIPQQEQPMILKARVQPWPCLTEQTLESRTIDPDKQTLAYNYVRSPNIKSFHSQTFIFIYILFIPTKKAGKNHICKG